MNLVTRRHLLRAAAVTAPLVATLPSGAAMAQTSAAQCVAKLQDEADMRIPAGESDPGSDTYIRVTAKTWTDTVKYYRFTAYNDDIVTVTEAGNRVMGVEQPSDASDVKLLVLYRPEESPVTGVELEPGTTEPGICDIKAGLTGWTNPAPNSPEGAYCIYPVADLGTSPFGNIGMTTGCLTSFVTG